MGSKIIHKTEEERKAAVRKSLAKAMRETPWYCEVCRREYILGGKRMHLKTMKHERNYYKDKPLIEF